MAEEFDFIVVGSGPAGAAIAGRLSRAKTAPKILLLEAGGERAANDNGLLLERFQNIGLYPDQQWGYNTEPVAGFDGRVLPYARGKVLGGSSTINFCAWTIGPKDDFERWAEEVGDEAFDWKHRVAVAKKMEAFDNDIAGEYSQYAKPDMSVHGTDGPIAISWPAAWDRGSTDRIRSAVEIGWPLNLDINNGNPIGFGANPATAKAGMRSTSAAYLEDPPHNLTIVTRCQATKIIFEGKRAVGVEAGSRRYVASKEVILSCGAFNSPKLLMLSGVGPKDELAKHGIEPIVHLPGVGQGLEDHLLCPHLWKEKTGHHLHLVNGTDLAPNLHNDIMMGFAKEDELLNQPEFQSLPPHVLKHMRKPTVPLYEMIARTSPVNPEADPNASFLIVMAITLCPASRGKVTLKSANPEDAPIIETAFFSHPADIAAARAVSRAAFKYVQAPSIKNDHIEPFAVPQSESDDDIDAFWRQNANTVWHASCTVKMGRKDDENVCLDSDFRVKGVSGLRVADQSAVPFVPNCHTQSVAYFIGETAAAKLIAEYSL